MAKRYPKLLGATTIALTDAATVAIDVNLGTAFSLTATGGVGATRALGNPTNGRVNQRIRIMFVQDGTGGRLLTFGGSWTNIGDEAQVAQAAAAVSFIDAELRGAVWYYRIQHVRGVSALTDAATVTVNADLGPSLSLLATSGVGNTRALGNPSGGTDGAKLNILYTQDSTGDRVLTFSGNWVNSGFCRNVNMLPSSTSLITAEKRGSNWYYQIIHANMAILEFVTVAGAKTLALTDNLTVQRTTSGSNFAITIPRDSDVNFPIGALIEVLQDAAGQVTLTPFDGTVTLKSRNSEFKTGGDGASIFLKKKAANTWQVTGDKAA